MVKYIQKGEYIDYIPASAVSAGDVVVIGGLATVAKLDIPASTLGALCTEGVYDFPKGSATSFSAGADIYWDGSAAVASASDANKVGVAVAEAVASAASVRVLLNA